VNLLLALDGAFLLLVGWATLSEGIGFVIFALGLLWFAELLGVNWHRLFECLAEQPAALHAQLRCDYCGVLLPVTTRYCSSCGAPL
jgi:hypothetical protein